MRTLSILLRKELVEQWRTMRMPIFLAVFLFVGVMSPASAKFLPNLMEAIGGPSFAAAFPTPTVVDAYAQLAKNVAQLGALIVIVIAMSAVSSERDRGTLAFLLSKPVGRGSFLAGKLVAIAVTLALGMLVAAVVAYAYTALLFGPPGAGFWLLCLAAYLALLVFAAITLAASAITGSAVAAGGVGLASLVFFGVMSLLPNVGVYTPAGSLTRAIDVVGGAGAEGLVGPWLTEVGVVAAAFVIALAVLRRQEV